MHQRSDAGFTLIDMLITVGLIGVLGAIAAPSLMNLGDNMKLGQAAREVERELQTARLKAVTSNRPIRVRFNCPVAGQYRMVELIGTPALPAANDSAASRCQETDFPFPAGDTNPLTRPNHDGPLRRLPDVVAFGAVSALEFWPDGSVHKQAAGEQPWAGVPAPAGTAITLVKGTEIRRITVNGLGKITLVQ